MLIDYGFLILGGIFLFGMLEPSIEFKENKLPKSWNILQEKIGIEGYKIVDQEKTSTGLRITVEIPIGGTIKELESYLATIEKAYSCKCLINDIPYSQFCELELITKEITELDYKLIELEGTKLLIGYDYKGSPIIADMIETPHLLLTGLSGNGKTGMIRIAIKNLIENDNADIMLLNGFMDDYKGFKIDHITNQDSIKIFIEKLLEDMEEGKRRVRPLYVIFEELGKIKDKELINLTTKLLQYGRHNKIYLIGIIQTATKEELKFKSLFNARCTFKQLEESSYRVVLGCSIEEKLKKREFYLFTDDLYKGRTYRLDF